VGGAREVMGQDLLRQRHLAEARRADVVRLQGTGRVTGGGGGRRVDEGLRPARVQQERDPGDQCQNREKTMNDRTRGSITTPSTG